MAAGEGQAVAEGELQGPEGLLFTGEAIRALTPERLAAIGDFANRMYGVEMREVRGVERELGGMTLAEVERADPAPVPMRQKDFKAFAAERGIGESIAYSAWHWVLWEKRQQETGKRQESPAIVVTLSGARQLVELTSLYAYLRQTFKTHERTSASARQEAFLVALLNETLQPSEPLASERLRRK